MPAPGPNRLWASDFSYVASPTGFVYVVLVFVIDASARRIVGWRASRTARAGFVLDALERAPHERRPVRGGGLVHYSDHSTVTDLARLRGWSTSVPIATAV
jgi:putative transposase